MTTITWNNVSEAGETYRLFAEASSLGLRPGEWPTTIEAAVNVGNGQPFTREGVDRDADGDLIGVRYRQAFGLLRLTIAND